MSDNLNASNAGLLSLSKQQSETKGSVPDLKSLKKLAFERYQKVLKSSSDVDEQMQAFDDYLEVKQMAETEDVDDGG